MPTSGARDQTEQGDNGNEYRGNEDSRAVASGRVNNHEPARSPKDRTYTHFLPHDKTANEAQNNIGNISTEPSKPVNRDEASREAQRLSLSCNNSLHSYAQERVDDETLKEEIFSNICAGSPTEVASDEGDDGEFGNHQNELQQRLSALEKSCDTDHPPVLLSVSNEDETRTGPSQPASQRRPKIIQLSKTLLIYLLSEDATSPGVPNSKPCDKMDFMSLLSKGQQAQYAPLKDKASLCDIGALQPQMHRPRNAPGPLAHH
ncbi:hypothetical protein K469DRAFT_1406 [Zopfia rhizophila CBS 207.26]|uniref:Uncharacterized protein n=1 Tax=Zopfia rhizophila CBS 207.26 TaxID=1314779 RepID=A0A6A6EW18_9PEZI|nr:hypothetical protein K469DRAFT_1406 [Zopfia rhizophila CBS 207.26]